MVMKNKTNTHTCINTCILHCGTGTLNVVFVCLTVLVVTAVFYAVQKFVFVLDCQKKTLLKSVLLLHISFKFYFYPFVLIYFRVDCVEC